MNDQSKKLPSNYYFDNDLVEKLLIEYHKTGCTDISLRDKIMEHADELIINVIRAHNLHNIYTGRDDSSFNDLYQIAWCSIESALYKFNSKPGHPKIFNMWCCAPDTLMFTDNGIEQIQEVVLRITSLAYWSNTLHRIGAGLIKPENKTLKIITAMGYNIECSYEHPILTYKDNKIDLVKAKNLAINDLVAIQYDQQHFIDDNNIDNSTIKKISKNLAYLIGLFIANGYLSDDKLIIYNAPNKIDKLLFNYKIDSVYDSNNKSLRIYDNRLIKLMLQCGFKPNEDCSYIPTKLLRMSKINTILLLTGIFNNGQLFRITNKYKTNSKLLANQLAMMLLNLGMPIVINGNNDGWLLKLFSSKMPYSIRQSQTFHKMYKQFITYNKEVRTNKELCNLMLNMINNKNELSKIAKLLRLNDSFKNINNIIWLPIVKLQESHSKLCEVNVLSQDHLYISNGFISHNSQIARTAILAAIKKDNRDKKNFDGYRKYLDLQVSQDKAQFIRFLNEARIVYRYVDEFMKIIDAMEKIYLHDPRPYEGLTNKLAKLSNMSRVKVVRFIKILRMMNFEFTDSPINDNHNKKIVIKPSMITLIKDDD